MFRHMCLQRGPELADSGGPVGVGAIWSEAIRLAQVDHKDRAPHGEVDEALLDNEQGLQQYVDDLEDHHPRSLALKVRGEGREFASETLGERHVDGL